MSHLYEVALYGEFFAQDLKPILNRLTLHCESATRMHSRELVFEPLDAQAQRDQGNEPVFLRCKKELTEPGSGWYVWLPFINTLRNSVMGQLDIARLTHDLGEYRTMFSYLKPESVRQYPDATVRPWATCQVAEDALSFASALGYVRRAQLYKNGYAFRRGPLLIQMFQQEQVDARTSKPIPAQADTLWEVEVKTASPWRPSQETPLAQAIEAVLEVQKFMKGLLDLRRKDV